MWEIKEAIAVGVGMMAALSHAASIDRLCAAKAKYPYSLIGEDFGILSEADLASNTCHISPQPFSPKSDSSYWRCFESKRVTFSCDSSGVPDPNEGVMGLIVVSVKNERDSHEYIARRPWPIADCRAFGRTFAGKKKGTEHICISGSFAREKMDERGSKFTSWFFEKYKTRKGCESYFEGDCDLAYQIKHGCKVARAK